MALAIPFSPSPYIQNFNKAVVPIQAVPSKICKPPTEGFKFVPMQFLFPGPYTWLVDMSLGSPQPPLSQTCAVYIDASLCEHESFIYFPDSGFTHVIGRATCAYIPVITGKDYPLFYIGISPNNFAFPYPSDLASGNRDLINIFVMNQFVPGFSNLLTINAIPVSLAADNFQPVYKYFMDDIFESNTAISGGVGIKTVTLLNHNQWYVTDLDISILGNTTDGSVTPIIITLLDNGTPFMVKNFLLTPEYSMVQLFDRSDLNYKSNGGGAMTCTITDANGNLSATLAANVMGGVLVP